MMVTIGTEMKIGSEVMLGIPDGSVYGRLAGYGIITAEVAGHFVVEPRFEADPNISYIVAGIERSDAPTRGDLRRRWRSDVHYRTK